MAALHMVSPEIRLIVLALPNDTRTRLYYLARHRHQRIDRVVEDLIDAASKDLPIAVWERSVAPASPERR